MSENNIFTKEEDFILIKLVRMFGTKKWKNISVYLSKIFPERPKNQKICKNRWFKILNPKINNKGWSLVEEYVFFESQKILGNKWATISKLLPGRTDNNIKNHFYSTLRKNIRRFLKDKANFSCIKDKIKTFYTMIYAREKFKELKKFYDKKTNTVDLKKATSDNVNFDDNYISELICKSGGSIETVDEYLTNICIDLIENNSETFSEKFLDKDFDINSQKDIDVIYEVISNLVMKNAISMCHKILPGLQENNSSKKKINSENQNSNISLNMNNFSNSDKKFHSRKSSDSNHSKNLIQQGKYQLQKIAYNLDNIINIKEEVDVCNQHEINGETIYKNNKTNKLHALNPNNSHINNHFHNIHHDNTEKYPNNFPKEESQVFPSYFKKLNNSAHKPALSDDTINNLIGNFTKKFSNESNIFENVKNMNSFNIPQTCESSTNNMFSLMISKIFNETNSNQNNLFEDFNCNVLNNREKSFQNNTDWDKIDTNTPFINNDLMEKLQSVNNFDLFKRILEKVIVNNISNYYTNNTEGTTDNVQNCNKKNSEKSGVRLDHFNSNNQNNLGYSNEMSNLGNILNESDLHKLYKKFEKIKKEKSNSNFLNNKANRSEHDN